MDQLASQSSFVDNVQSLLQSVESASSYAQYIRDELQVVSSEAKALQNFRAKLKQLMAHAQEKAAISADVAAPLASSHGECEEARKSCLAAFAAFSEQQREKIKSVNALIELDHRKMTAIKDIYYEVKKLREAVRGASEQLEADRTAALREAKKTNAERAKAKRQLEDLKAKHCLAFGCIDVSEVDFARVA